jgi:AraC-like DNA-binding protein
MPNVFHYPLSAQNPYEALERIVATYKTHKLVVPDPGWPADVRVLLMEINEYLSEAEVKIGELRRSLGLVNHDVSEVFARYVGLGPKRYQLYHRIELGRLLLEQPSLQRISVTEIAMAVGFVSLGAFSKSFKGKVGCAPTTYRAVVRVVDPERLEKDEDRMHAYETPRYQPLPS